MTRTETAYYRLAMKRERPRSAALRPGSRKHTQRETADFWSYRMDLVQHPSTSRYYASPELDTLYDRVEKGIEWLTAKDPTGAFHLWYEAGILPSSPKPGQDEATRQGYAEYHPQRGLFERLWKRMEALEISEKNAAIAKESGSVRTGIG
jgi:hypothetical protein